MRCAWVVEDHVAAVGAHGSGRGGAAGAVPVLDDVVAGVGIDVVFPCMREGGVGATPSTYRSTDAKGDPEAHDGVGDRGLEHLGGVRDVRMAGRRRAAADPPRGPGAARRGTPWSTRASRAPPAAT